MNEDTKLAKFLDFLEVGVEAPTLPYLNKLVEAHQKKVRWETFTKFAEADW